MNFRNTLALSACLTLASHAAFAQTAVEGDIESSGSGYVNVGGLVVKTSSGDCVQTGSLSEDNVINQCAGIADEVVDTEIEVVQAATPVPPPAPTPQVSTINTQEFSEFALFESNSATLNTQGKAAMNLLFDALSDYEGITNIKVIGHTDSRGNEAYNQALSEQRAATVAAEIVVRYPDANIEIIGMGERSPIATNDTAEGRQQNRRVEIEITASRVSLN